MSPLFLVRAADSVGSSALSSPLTSSGPAPHHASHHHHRAQGINLSETLDPLDILTGEGLSGDSLPRWLSCEPGGESNLVASGMDKVGELDPGEVRRK